MKHTDQPRIVPWDPFSAVPSMRRWLWLLFAIVICGLQGPDFVRSLRPTPPENGDFVQDWLSAKNYVDGLPIYAGHDVSFPKHLNLRAVKRGDQIDANTDAVLNIEVNAHPPTSVLLVLPLAALSYPDATLVWNLLSLIALGASCLILIRQLRLAATPWCLIPVVTVLLVCSPFRQQMGQGQWNLILLLLLVGVWACARSGRDVWAGVLLGLAMTIKLVPGFLLLYFLLGRRWRVVFSGTVSALAITLLTAIVLGPETADHVRHGNRTYRQRVRYILDEFVAHGHVSQVIRAGSRGRADRFALAQPVACPIRWTRGLSRVHGVLGPSGSSREIAGPT